MTGKGFVTRMLMLLCAISIALSSAVFLSTSSKAASPITSSDFLKASGKVLRKNYGQGEVVQLRGVNAGGYMLQEFWMTPTSYNYGTYTVTCEMDIYETLTARFGEAKMRELVGIYQDNYWKESDFDNCAALGINCIRLPVWYMNFVDFNGNYLPNAFARLDWFIQEAGERGIYVIIDMHGAPGSQNGSDHSGIDGGDNKEAASEFFFGPNAWKNQQLYYDLWYRIAQRYRGNPVVAGYDLLNEPFCTYRYTTSIPENELHSMLWDIYNNAYNVIRSVDPDHVIIMEAVWDPWDLPDPSVYGWTNVMYQYHNYYYGDYDNANGQQVASLQNKVNLILSQNYNVPSMMGEFNLFNNLSAWQQGLQILNNSGLSWTMWTYKVTGTNNNWGLYNQNVAYTNVATDSEAQIRAKWSNVGNASPNQALINTITPYFTQGQPGYPETSLPNGDYYITAIANNKVVCADNYGNDPLIANRDSFAGDWEKFTIVNNGDGTFSLRSGANNKYVCAVIDESSQLLARSSAINTWEKFILYKIKEGEYAIKSVANGKFVQANLNSNAVLYASASSVAGAWEAFRITPVSGSGGSQVVLPDGNYYITAVANNKVVCADNYGNSPLIANRDSYAGAWEQFTIVNNSDGTVSFRSGANNKYVCAVIDESSQLLARSSAIDTWEKFIIEPIGGNQYAIKSVANGKYVKADLNNNAVLYATNPNVAGAWEAFYITKIN